MGSVSLFGLAAGPKQVPFGGELIADTAVVFAAAPAVAAGVLVVAAAVQVMQDPQVPAATEDLAGFHVVSIHVDSTQKTRPTCVGDGLGGGHPSPFV